MASFRRLRVTAAHIAHADVSCRLASGACSGEAGAAYVPPRVWKNDAEENRFSGINRPTAGARTEQPLPEGRHPFQLHSLGTPNGQKVSILLEELNEALGIEYDAWPVNIMSGDQFTSGFVSANPNSKIPALVDRTDPSSPIRVFESGSILLHLADKYGRFIPAGPGPRAECISWLMWQMSSAPFIGGGFGHFYAYAPRKMKYPIDRYTMEVKRTIDVADQRLKDREYLCGSEYTIADIAVYPWFKSLFSGGYVSGEVPCNVFLEAHTYTNVVRWLDRIGARPAVDRGMRVNRLQGKRGLRERHSRADFDA